MANERILLVEDNPSNVKLARLLLEKAGFEVQVAGDSHEALEALRSFSPRVILMDIQLPGMDGLTLARHMRERGLPGDTIIIAVTAYAMNGDEARAKAAGCDGYISKPINTRTFADQVRSYFPEAPKEPVKQPPETDPNDLLMDLRNRFLAEGTETSYAYAAQVPAGDQAEQIRRSVHHWAGMGGTLGFPAITSAARDLETLLETRPPEWEQQASQQLKAIHLLFSGSMGSGGGPDLPKDLAQDLASKQIGLIGFDESESSRVRAAFDHVQAVVRDLGAVSDGLGMEALHTHDLVVLNACTEEGVRSWDSVFAQPLLRQPILVVASRSALVDAKLALTDRAADFVLEPWDAEELLYRAQKAICQKRVLPAQRTERSGKPSVILADDDPMIHSLLVPMLNKVGVDCYSARNGHEALDMVEKLSADVLILDIGMPGMSGMAVLREIRKGRHNTDLRILMLSARQQRSDISMALAFGANDYAVKPFDPADLMLRITKLLSRCAGAAPAGLQRDSA